MLSSPHADVAVIDKSALHCYNIPWPGGAGPLALKALRCLPSRPRFLLPPSLPAEPRRPAPASENAAGGLGDRVGPKDRSWPPRLPDVSQESQEGSDQGR